METAADALTRRRRQRRKNLAVEVYVDRSRESRRPLLTQSGDDPESPKERTQRGQPLEKSDSLAEFLFRPLRVHSSGTTPSHLRRGQSALSLHRKNSRKPRGKIPVSPATDYATFSNSRHVASHGPWPKQPVARPKQPLV